MRRACAGVLAILAVIGYAPAVLAQCTGGVAPTCRLTKAAPVIFVGTVASIDNDTVHFRVDEPFAGVKDGTIDVSFFGFVEGSTGYVESVTRYLVFAQTVRLDDGRDHAYVGGCGRQMIPFPSAAPDLEQLRRERRGQRVASAFGTLLRTGYADTGWLEPADEGVLPNIVLRFQSDRSTVTTRTRPDGRFVVERLPKGTYRISGDLPDGLKLGQTILDEPLAPIDVDANTCHSLVVTAVPTGTISGRVIGPDGKPRDGVSVNLFRAGNRSLEMTKWQGDGKPFEFSMLPPGGYVLAYGNGTLDPDNPFPDTFYPSAPDAAGATVIHLAPGQKVVNADIHLPPGRPTRELAVVLNWNGVRAADTYSPIVTVKATDGGQASARKVADDAYAVNLLLDATYSIHATAACKEPGMPAATTETMVAEASDRSKTRVTLTFVRGGCAPK